MGGYCDRITVDEHFVFMLEDNMPLERVGPLLCAGVTTWDPLVHHGAKKGGKGFKLGVMGFGGLGHMAVKLGVSFGNDVYCLSRSPHKKKWADELGAKFILTTDREQMRSIRSSLDLIINTVSANHDLRYIWSTLKKPDGHICLVGLPPNDLKVHPF
eukprot:UN30746